jgi:CP family cyanate transporter-like MFS transporter
LKLLSRARAALRRGAMPAAVLVALALCLRGPFAAVGPLVEDLAAEYGVGLPSLAVLTALPLLCFASASPVAPALAARLGLRRAVLAGAVAVAMGIGVRAASGPGLFAGTVVLACGIAVVNVLLPAVVRADHGPRASAVLGATTASIALSASLGAGLAQPFAALTGSATGSLLVWLAPVAVAVAAFAVFGLSGTGGARPRPATGTRFILRDRVALAVTVYFGLQAMSFYTMLAWLPTILLDTAGVELATGGALLALAAALGAPAALVVPRGAARARDQSRWIWAVTIPNALALVGLIVAADAAPAMWALLYGLGTGAAFPLAMTLMVLRTTDAAQTGRLSASAQSVGYLLAAAGPLGVGLLHDAVDGWRIPMVVLIGLLVAQIAAGLAAARGRFVADQLA